MHPSYVITPWILGESGTLLTWCLVKEHRGLLCFDTWPNKRASSVSFTLSLIVRDIDIPIVQAVCPILIIARTGLSELRKSSAFTDSPSLRFP